MKTNFTKIFRTTENTEDTEIYTTNDTNFKDF